MLSNPKPPAGGVAPVDGAKILPFTPKARAHRRRLPPIKDPLRTLEDAEDRARMLQNIAAALIVIALVGGGFWLTDHLLTSARIATCLEAGHRHCLQDFQH